MNREEVINLEKQRQWQGKPGELMVPEDYLKDLKYEIIVFARKERGGSDFTFRCKDYRNDTGGQWTFANVIIDTSRKNPQGLVELARITYHPRVTLVNVGFMAIPAPESEF